MQVLESRQLQAERWPSYRPRRQVVAQRLHEPLWLDGDYHRSGYLVRTPDGHFAVMSVAAFEAVYELEAR